MPTATLNMISHVFSKKIRVFEKLICNLYLYSVSGSELIALILVVQLFDPKSWINFGLWFAWNTRALHYKIECYNSTWNWAFQFKRHNNGNFFHHYLVKEYVTSSLSFRGPFGVQPLFKKRKEANHINQLLGMADEWLWFCGCMSRRGLEGICFLWSTTKWNSYLSSQVKSKTLSVRV